MFQSNNGGIYWERILTLSVLFTLAMGMFSMIFRFSGLLAQLIYASASLWISVQVTKKIHPRTTRVGFYASWPEKEGKREPTSIHEH